MKIAFLAPKQKWSIYHKFLEYKRFLEELNDVSVDVFANRGMQECLVDYDLIIGAVKRQRSYENKFFRRIRDRFIGLVTGYDCRDFVSDWSIFKNLWFWADCYIDERFESNTVFSEPFGVDHNLFKPIPTEKEFFTLFVGNADWPKKRIKSHFIPLCEKVDVTYRIVDGRINWIPQAELPLIYNKSKSYLCTSIYEAGPAPVLEAASCGIPIIGCDSGFSRMFKRKAVFLCDSWDDYVHALETLKTSDNTRRKMGQEARKEILENWTWEKRIPSLVRKLETLGVM